MDNKVLTENPIKIANDIYGRPFEYLPEGKVKGRNTLKRLGYSVCTNPDYMASGDIYFHFNGIKGCWLGDTPRVNAGDRVIYA